MKGETWVQGIQMKSPGISQLDRMRSKNTVTPLQSRDCYHGTKPLQSSHPEE